MSSDARWIYKVVRFKSSKFFKLQADPEEIADLLNQMGRDGWELVHVVEGYGIPSPVLYLKRPA